MRIRVLLSALIVAHTPAQPALADYMVDFVRIGCVPEAGFFEIEHRLVHNNPAEAAPSEAWARQGFYSPSNLAYECNLGRVKYKVVAHQEGWRDRGMCAASPEVILSVSRNDVQIVDKIVFGYSCPEKPSITRIGLTERKEGYFTREAEICYLTEGEHGSQPECEWFFEGLNGLDAAFPLRQETLSEQILKWRPK